MNPYPEEHFPSNEYASVNDKLYPYPIWLDALDTAGLQVIAERTRGTPRAVGRTLAGLKTPETAAVARARAAELCAKHHGGIDPESAPPDLRIVAVVQVCYNRQPTP